MREHTPVLLKETLDLLRPIDGDRVLDVTLGLGGHAEAFLNAAHCTLIGIDADANNLHDAKERLSEHADRITCIHSNFSAVPECLPKTNRQFDIIIADLGLSSPHLDNATRGFSFRYDAPLDMRFDQTSGQTAAMLLSSLDRLSLIGIFKDNGEIRQAHRLVDTIIERRKTDPIRTTYNLRDAVIATYGKATGEKLLPQVFQALRMAVNEELPALEILLKTGMQMLAPSGRFGVITFHSLEDRVVKNTFRDATTPERDPVTGADTSPAEYTLLTKRAIVPSEHEITHNPRSRSARLRAMCKNP